MAGGRIGQVDAAVALAALRPSRYQPGRVTSRAVLPSTRIVSVRASGSRAVMVPRVPLATPSWAMALRPHTTRSPTANWRSSTWRRSGPRRPRAASSC